MRSSPHAGNDPNRVSLAYRGSQPSGHARCGCHGHTACRASRLTHELGELISDRPVYIHLDCDVLDPGIVPTEYRVPGGLSLMDLERAAVRLARNPLIGLEIAEFESEQVEKMAGPSPGA
jgi:arginase